MKLSKKLSLVSIGVKMLKDQNFKITDHNQALFVDLDDKSSEIISGGIKTFSIKNTLNSPIIYYIDGAEYKQDPATEIQWATTGNGKIEFDSSWQDGYQGKTWTLLNNSTNEFQLDKTTTWVTGDFDIYRTGFA